MWRIVSFGIGIGRQAWSVRWRKGRTVAAGAAVAAVLAGTSVAGAPAASASLSETVIVTATGLLSPVAAVLRVGGTVLTQFHLINGVEASIPSIAEPVLAALPGITVTPDVSVSVQSTTESTGPHTPSDAFLPETGATRLAASGDTGQGVTVAVLDTGIDNLPDFSGRLVGGRGPDGREQPVPGQLRAWHLRGRPDRRQRRLVERAVLGRSAGRQSGVDQGGGGERQHRPGDSDPGPAVGGRSPEDVRHQGPQHLPGVPADQSTVINPLDQAVEAVWNSGITVVASAGNAGPFNGTILSPGDDPLVITVGALDDMATPSTADDEMNDFSSVGPTSADGWVKPDLVTSGRSVVSLAAPGSTIYNSYPSARIGPANFVGSGTSFSAAITSGAAALVLADNPGLTPNQVKARLLGNTDPGPVGNPFVDGHGALNAYAAATSGPMNFSQSAACLRRPSRATVSLAPTGAPSTPGTRTCGRGCLEPGGLQRPRGTAGPGTARTGTAGPGPAGPGTTAAGPAQRGTATTGPAGPGTTRLDRLGLERLRLERLRLEQFGVELSAARPAVEP